MSLDVSYGHACREWPLSVVGRWRTIGSTRFPFQAISEVLFGWPGPAAVEPTPTPPWWADEGSPLCAELLISGPRPCQLLRLSLHAHDHELMSLDTLDGGRGDLITAGEMLWGMASMTATGMRGRLSIPIAPTRVPLAALRLTLQLTIDVRTCQVSARSA